MRLGRRNSRVLLTCSCSWTKYSIYTTQIIEKYVVTTAATVAFTDTGPQERPQVPRQAHPAIIMNVFRM